MKRPIDNCIRGRIILHRLTTPTPIAVPRGVGTARRCTESHLPDGPQPHCDHFGTKRNPRKQLIVTPKVVPHPKSFPVSNGRTAQWCHSLCMRPHAMWLDGRKPSCSTGHATGTMWRQGIEPMTWERGRGRRRDGAGGRDEEKSSSCGCVYVC